jgi:hypothetical protein
MLYALVDFIIPKDPESTGGLYLGLNYYNEDETQQLIAHLFILKSGENFSLVMENDSKELCNQFGEIKAKVYTRAVNKQQLFNEVSKLSFLKDAKYFIRTIKHVSHNFSKAFHSFSEETISLDFFVKDVKEVRIVLS